MIRSQQRGLRWREENPSWEVNSHSSSQEISGFYGTQKFVTVSTRVRHWLQSWARWIQSIFSHLASSRSILMLFSQICLGPRSGLFPSDFPAKFYKLFPYLYPLPRALHATPISLSSDFITLTIFGEELKLWSSSLGSFLQHPIILFLLSQNVLKTLFFP